MGLIKSKLFENEDTPDSQISLKYRNNLQKNSDLRHEITCEHVNIFNDCSCENEVVEGPSFLLDDDFYDMSHQGRGTAVILNHKNYVPYLCLNRRRGTDRDKDNLFMTLKDLGFDVEVHEDLTYKGIQEVLQRLYNETDHTNADCILIAVLTHGEKDGILYANDYPYASKHLWEHFDDVSCRSLAGKPKIFVIQACRGEEYDTGMQVKWSSPHDMTTTQHDANHIDSSLPSYPDVLVMHSTIEGFYSWRHTREGSWFIRSFCQILGQHCKLGMDFLSCMTKVTRMVALEFESKNPNYPDINEMKQVPCINSTLTKNLILQPSKNLLQLDTSKL